MKRVFGFRERDDSWIGTLYDDCRCGLFHDGMTRTRVMIENRYDVPVEYDAGQIRISPNGFLDVVSRFFDQYVADLKDTTNVELRSRFEKMWQWKSKSRSRSAKAKP